MEKVKASGEYSDEIEAMTKQCSQFFASLKIKSTISTKIKRFHAEDNINLLEPVKSELIDWFARSKSSVEAHSILLTKYKINVTIPTISKFRDINKALIQETKAQYNASLEDIPLTVKRRRLEEYQNLYYKRKNQYELHESVENTRIMMSLLEAIRNETDGMQLKIDLDISHQVDIHLQQDEIKGMNIPMMVLAKVCGKRGINPLWMLAKLENSIYRKFNHVVNEDIYLEQHDNVIYPSDVPIDWDKMEKLQNQKQQEKVQQQKQITLNQPIESEKEKKVSEFRKAFLEKLQKAKNKK